MGWPAHDPEGWREVCISGVLKKLDRGRGLTQPNRDVDRQVLENLEDDLGSYNVWLALLEWASHEVSEAESDYFAWKIDDAMEPDPRL